MIYALLGILLATQSAWTFKIQDNDKPIKTADHLWDYLLLNGEVDPNTGDVDLVLPIPSGDENSEDQFSNNMDNSQQSIDNEQQVLSDSPSNWNNFIKSYKIDNQDSQLEKRLGELKKRQLSVNLSLDTLKGMLRSNGAPRGHGNRKGFRSRTVNRVLAAGR